MTRKLILSLVALFAFTLVAHAAKPVGPKKKAAAAPLKGQLKIDGKLDDAAWDKAPVNTGFEQTLGPKGRRPLPEGAPQTSFRVLYDKDTLYIGIRCNEPKMDDLVVKAADQWDAAMWSDDDVELFIDPVGDRVEFYQMAVNSQGTQVDLYFIESGNTQKDPWSSAWKAEVFKGKDFWSVEMAIPFAVFHNRPSKTWDENWVFSVSRTRKPKPSYFSQYSPGNGYHDVANFGTLGPIKIDRTRYNLYADAPEFRLEPKGDGFAVSGSVLLENRGDTPVTGKLALEVSGIEAEGAEVPVTLEGGASRRVSFSGAYVAREGKYPTLFKVVDKQGTPRVMARFDEWLNYEPLVIDVTVPNYRNSIYATQTINTIKGTVALGMPVEKVAGYKLKVGLYSNSIIPRELDLDPAETVPFELDARFLPEGDYRLRAMLYKKAGDKRTVLAETTTTIRKLPPAPDIEVRVSPAGNVLVNGQPVFIRGWYGSMHYIGSNAALPQAQMPHSTNFMMGSSTFEQVDLGLYTLAGVSRRVDEAKAKLDQPIDDELKDRLLEAIARTRGKRNVIGYYISDEPECRGLSPYFLKSLYDFMKKHDPYRLVKIVSRAPARYIEACDVMCPHPYLSPQVWEDGTRRFGNSPKFIGTVVQEAVRAGDGSKAVWVMPQTFSYGGLRGKQPTFLESRFFAFAGIAGGARGMVPFIFNGYWNHWENRVSMNHVFETLTFLAPVWTDETSDTDSSSSNDEVAVIAKDHRGDGVNNVYVVAVNEGYDDQQSTFKVPALARHKIDRLVVLREGRTVKVNPDGTFTDRFGRLGVHVYTSLEVLPAFKSLEEIRHEIDAPRKRAAEAGNILAGGDIEWWIDERNKNFSTDLDLADGITDAAGWIPWYGDKTQMVVELEKPVSVARVVVHSPSLKAATLEAWVDGQWKTLHRWEDHALQEMTWSGDAVKTTKFRFSKFATRRNTKRGAMPEITELGLYAK